jgi:hypothetical protein
MDPNNPVVHQCAQGVQAEAQGRKRFAALPDDDYGATVRDAVVPCLLRVAGPVRQTR